MSIYVFDGHMGDVLIVNEDTIEIAHKFSFVGFTIYGILYPIIYLTRSGRESISIANIQSMEFRKPGKMLGGWIYLTVGGKKKKVNIYRGSQEFIDKAEEIANHINAKIMSMQKAPQPATNDIAAAADAISKLKDLLDDGAITQEEFDKKKAELLG